MTVLTRWPQMASSPATLEPRAPQPTTATTTIVFTSLLLYFSFFSSLFFHYIYQTTIILPPFSLQSDQCHLHHSLTLFIWRLVLRNVLHPFLVKLVPGLMPWYQLVPPLACLAFLPTSLAWASVASKAKYIQFHFGSEYIHCFSLLLKTYDSDLKLHFLLFQK